MADGGVKNMRMRFEQSSDDATTPDKKPQVANKPKPLVKPASASTGNDAANQTDSSGKSVSSRALKDNCFNRSLNNALAPNDNNNKSSPFMKDLKAGDGKPFVPSKSPKYGAAASEVSKPSTLPKSVAMGPKPGSSDKPKFQPKVAIVPKPDVDKTEASKTDSARSSSSSDSSASSNLPTSSNASIFSNSETNNASFDFSESRRPIGANRVPHTKMVSVGNENSSQSPKSTLVSPSPPPLPKSTPPLPPSKPSAKSTSKEEVQAPHPVFKLSTNPRLIQPGVDLVQLRSRLKSKKGSTEKEEANILQRQSDDKKFRKIARDKSTYPPTAPEKPSPPSDVDLSSLQTEYEQAVTATEQAVTKKDSKSDEDVPEEEDEEDGELYAAGESMVDFRPPKISRKSERFSMIPDISAEEEGAYDDTPADDIYSCAESETRVPNGEASKSDGETEQEKKRRQKEEIEAKRREETEKKKREKQKKKNPETKWNKKFKLTGDEYVGEGVIKNDAKGSGSNIKVHKGQMVTIVRIDNNPQNKWLVKTENQMGFVDSNNISVEPNIIKQAMTNHKKGSAVEDESEQPTYDAVPEDTSGADSTSIVEELEYDDVYEECP